MSPDEQLRAPRNASIKEKSMKKEYRPMLATLVDQPFDTRTGYTKPSGTAFGSLPK
jgi:hypothetical protein